MFKLAVKMAKIVRIRTRTRIRTRIKRNVPTPKGLVPPRRGGKGAGKPKDDRATAKKET